MQKEERESRQMNPCMTEVLSAKLACSRDLQYCS